MPNNPLTQAELTAYTSNTLYPQIPAGYFFASPPTGAGPLAYRLFDASYISIGIINPNRLGTGATGAGNLYLADDGTWKSITVATPTLQQVTTAGNTTSNSIVYSGTTEAIRPSVDSTSVLGASNLRWLSVYTRGVNSGSNTLDIGGPSINLNDTSGNIKLKLYSSTGNVVLRNGGTFTDAGYRLDVIGNVRIYGANEDASNTGALTIATTNTNLRLGGNTTYSWIQSHSARPLYINELGNNLILNLVGGNVGIGTASPSYKLQVQGSVYFNGTTNDFYVDGVSRFGGANSYSTIINNVGNVGIGITPTSKLQVEGLSILTNSAGGNYNENIRLPESTGGWASIVMGGAIATSGTGATVWSLTKYPSASGHRFGIMNNTTERFTIFTSGNVSIGTSTDAGYKLDVTGTLRVQSVPAGTADYDRFLVSDSGAVKYRTGNEILSDIDIPGYVSSRGENLVTNGTGLRKSNYNFSTFTFTGSDAYYSTGSFQDSAFTSARFTDEAIPVDVNQRYRLSVSARQNPYVGARYYIGISSIDADGLAIGAINHMYKANTLTTLAAQLNPGDTTVYLTSAANWENGGTAGVNTHLRSFIFWNYVNSFGYAFPPLTYSRNWYGNMWNPGGVNTTTNTISLITPWTGPVIAAGTQLSNGSSGGTYKYITAGNVQIPNAWTSYTGIIEGIDTTGTNIETKFSPGTAAIKVLFLNNRDVAGATVYYTNVQFGLDLVNPNTHVLNSTSLQTANFNISGNGYLGGNLGIGTTSPQSKLDVKGSQNNTISTTTGIAKFIGLDVGVFVGTLAGTPNYGSWIQSMRQSDGLTFPLLLQPSGGNIGVGTKTPISALTVDNGTNGNLTVGYLMTMGTTAQTSSSNSFIGSNVYGGAGDNIYALRSGFNAQFLQFVWNDSIRFHASTTTYTAGDTISNIERMRITATGNLLVGTTTDAGYRLDVNGTARIQGTTTITPAANTSAIVSTGYSVTGSGTTPLIDLSGTWNTTGNVNALRINITNTASGIGSNLINLQVGGNTLFRVSSSSISGITNGGPLAANGYGLGNGSAGIFTVDGTGAFTSTGTSMKFSDGLLDVGYSYIFESGQYVNKTFTSGTGGFISVKRGFAPTSGTGQLNILHLQNTINQTGGANGITRGLYIQPTLTAAADWRSIEWTNNAGWGLYGTGTGLNYLNGSLLVGTTTNAGYKLDVNGTARVQGAITSTALTTDGPVVSTSGVLGSVAGYTGMVTIQQPVPLPPVTFDIQNGIIVNVL
jgi:hypothetical protein